MALKDLRLKLKAAYYVATASRLVSINRLTLQRYALEQHRYSGLSEGLKALPVPEALRIGRHTYPVPSDLDAFCADLTYGQRQYLAEKEGIDVGVILRLTAGYYYPIATGRPWNEKQALSFGKIVLNSLVKDLYPVTNHLTTLMEQLVNREAKLLNRKPSKQEKAAGIDKLTKFADLTAMLFLQQSFNTTPEAVMLLPYNDCLVRFMLSKEQAAFQDRLTEVYRKERESKAKRP